MDWAARHVVHHKRTRPVSRRSALVAPQHAEFVSLRVGHDNPTHIALPDVNLSRPEAFQTRHLRVLIVRYEIEMQTVLHRLGVGVVEEQQGYGARKLRRVGPRSDPHVPIIFVEAHDLPFERRRPPFGELQRVAAVNRQRIYVQGQVSFLGSGCWRTLANQCPNQIVTGDEACAHHTGESPMEGDGTIGVGTFEFDDGLWGETQNDTVGLGH